MQVKKYIGKMHQKVQAISSYVQIEKKKWVSHSKKYML